MWKPTEGVTYRNTVTGQELTVTDVPNTAGVPTHRAENKMVEYEEDGRIGSNPVIWWFKRRRNMERVQ